MFPLYFENYQIANSVYMGRTFFCNHVNTIPVSQLTDLLSFREKRTNYQELSEFEQRALDF